MAGYHCLIRCMVYTALIRVGVHGAMFDFHLIEDAANNAIQKIRCQQLGYDGFAILSTPEAFKYAVEITDYVRNHLSMTVYIGAHYNAELNIVLWDDGTFLRSDTPFAKYPPKAEPGIPAARLQINKKLIMGEAFTARPALCGNHRNYPSHSIGRTILGELQTTSQSTLCVTNLYSYLECVLLCGMTYECRAAEFNSDIMRCTLIGEYSSTGTLTDPHILTYTRDSY